LRKCSYVDLLRKNINYEFLHLCYKNLQTEN